MEGTYKDAEFPPVSIDFILKNICQLESTRIFLKVSDASFVLKLATKTCKLICYVSLQEYILLTGTCKYPQTIPKLVLFS